MSRRRIAVATLFVVVVAAAAARLRVHAAETLRGDCARGRAADPAGQHHVHRHRRAACERRHAARPRNGRRLLRDARRPVRDCNAALPLAVGVAPLPRAFVRSRGSNVLLITGKSSSPQPAAQIANGIVQEGISERTARVQAQISAILDKLRTSSSTEARRRAIDLLALQNRPDPTLETLSAATAPNSAAWPKPARIISRAAGAALGLAALVLLVLWLIGAVRRRAAARPVRDPALDDREVALERRAAAIDQRERELQQVVAGRTEGERRQRTAKRARIEARVAAVTTRERALARQAAQLAAARARACRPARRPLEDLVAQSHKVPEPEPSPFPSRSPEPMPEPEPASPDRRLHRRPSRNRRAGPGSRAAAGTGDPHRPPRT